MGLFDPFKSLVSAGADQIFGALVRWLNEGANGLVNALFSFLLQDTTPVFKATWFASRYATSMQLMYAFVSLLLMACAISAILAGDPRRLIRAVVVQLPAAILGTFVALVLCQQLVSAVDWMCRQMFPNPAVAVFGIGQHIPASSAAAALVDGLVALGALILWLELLLREAAIYSTVLLLPFFLAALVWPATAKMAVRAIETLLALIVAKFVIVAVLALGLNAFDTATIGDLQGLMAAAALTLFASFAPWALLRLVPAVESAAVAHLEGVARRPLHALGVSSAAHQIPGLISQGLLHGSGGSGAGGSGGITASPSAVQAVMSSAAASTGSGIAEDRLDTTPRSLTPQRDGAA